MLEFLTPSVCAELSPSLLSRIIMTYKSTIRYVWLHVWILCALSFTSCAQLRFPQIDPSGRRLFQPAPATTQFVNPLGSGEIPGFPRPAFSQPERPLPCPQPETSNPAMPATAAPGSTTITPPAGEPPSQRIVITPFSSVAPIGSEVVLLAGITDPQGNYLTSQLLDWTLPADGPGQFTATRQTGRELLDWLARQRPGKPTAKHVTSVTASSVEVLDRGTANTQDDLMLAAGQSWIRLTSKSEGISQVTVTAPQAAQWNRQPQTAKVYWVDAQWKLPASISAPIGTPQTLTTTLTRRSTGLPLAGWIVRYQVLGKTDNANLGNDADKAMEVTTNAQGQASMQINPTTQQAGFTQVQIQISRPATADGLTPQLNVYQGWTTIAWSAPSLNLQASGPSRATVGATLQYQVTIINSGDLPANNVVLTDQRPAHLKLTGSSLAGQTFGDSTQWLIGDIPAHTTKTLNVRCQATKAGESTYRWNARSDNGLKAEATTTTTITAAKLNVSMTGPKTAQVGQKVQFNLTISNQSQVNLTNVSLSDRFDAGLQHVDRFQTRSAPDVRQIRLSIPQLAAGQTIQHPITFYVAQAGELCHQIDVTTPDGQHLQVRKCLTAVAKPDSKPKTTSPRQPVVPDPDTSNKNPRDPDNAAIPVRDQLVLKVSDFSDPITVGNTIKYVITLKNDRIRTDQRILLKIHFPAILELQKIIQDKSTDQPKFSADGRYISLPEIKEMLAGETIHFEVEFKATRFGPVTLRAEVTSTRTTKAVVATEETTVNP